MFKVGDKVRVIKHRRMQENANGHVGTIVELSYQDADDSPNVVGVVRIIPPAKVGHGMHMVKCDIFYPNEIELIDDGPLPLPG